MSKRDESGLLISVGGEVKALDEAGRFGGHIVLWGDAEHTDASSMRDFFTPETDFGRFAKGAVDVLYFHGLPKVGKDDNPLAGTAIGEAEFKADDVGLWMEGQLDLRDRYIKALFDKGVKGKKMGLSSGAVSHRVRREKQANGACKVVTWPIAEGSITPTPAEPRTLAREIKTLDWLKGEYLGDDAETNALASAIDTLQYRASYRLRDALNDTKSTVAEKLATCRGIYGEHGVVGMKIIEALIGGAGDSASIKALLEQFDAGDARASFLDACLGAVADLEWAASRFAKLGDSKRSAVKSLRDALDGLLTATAAKPDPADDLRLYDQFLALEARLAGV